MKVLLNWPQCCDIQAPASINGSILESKWIAHGLLASVIRRKQRKCSPIPLVGLLYVFPLRAPSLHKFVGLDWKIACQSLLLQAWNQQCCVKRANTT